MKKIIVLLFVGLLFGSPVFSQGYKIEVKVVGVNNQDLILGHHRATPGGLMPDDTVTTNNRGVAIFEGNEPLRQGMYFIFLPNKTYFDFIVGEDQKFSIKNDTTDLLTKMEVRGSDENEVFAAYHLFLIEKNQEMADLNAQYQIETDADKKTEIETQINDISQQFNDYYDQILNDHPDLFFTTFLKATKDVIIPPTITDRNQQYLYYKSHYFDNFDVGDPRLLYTPIYENKIDLYFERLVVPHPDSLIEALDFVIDASRHDSVLFKHNLIFLFNKYARSQLMIAENLYVHLADIYIDDAYWSTDSFKVSLINKNQRKKNCLIGNQAKDLHMFIVPRDSAGIELLKPPLQDMKSLGLEIERDTSRTFEDKVPDLSDLIAEYTSNFREDINLYEIEAKYTILWFMSPDCSHCITETPLLYDKFITELKQLDVAVFCVLLESNTDNWAKFTGGFTKWYNFIDTHKMYDDKWYNVLNPFENHRFNFDISSSPVLYVLDENKQIIAKKIGYEQAADMILRMEQ